MTKKLIPEIANGAKKILPTGTQTLTSGPANLPDKHHEILLI